jgi:hypothetical protein
VLVVCIATSLPAGPPRVRRYEHFVYPKYRLWL